MVLALLTGILAAVNDVAVRRQKHRDEVLAEAKANPGMAALRSGQIPAGDQRCSVLLIESVDGSDFTMFSPRTRPISKCSSFCSRGRFRHLYRR